MNIHETLVKLRVMLHEAEVDASTGDDAAVGCSINEMHKLSAGFEVEEDVPEEQCCSNCRHKNIHANNEPCLTCEDGNDLWESKTPPEEDDPEATKVHPETKVCGTCNHECSHPDEYPCCVCAASTHWEPKQ